MVTNISSLVDSMWPPAVRDELYRSYLETLGVDAPTSPAPAPQGNEQDSDSAERRLTLGLAIGLPVGLAILAAVAGLIMRGQASLSNLRLRSLQGGIRDLMNIRKGKGISIEELLQSPNITLITTDIMNSECEGPGAHGSQRWLLFDTLL